MGNGQNVSSGPNPGYTYSVPGDYLITLTATNSVGCSDDATQTIKVLQPPFAMIIPDNNLGCSPFLVNLIVLLRCVYPFLSLNDIIFCFNILSIFIRI